jgi:hypothetical protein
MSKVNPIDGIVVAMLYVDDIDYANHRILCISYASAKNANAPEFVPPYTFNGGVILFLKKLNTLVILENVAMLNSYMSINNEAVFSIMNKWDHLYLIENSSMLMLFRDLLRFKGGAV